MLCMILFHLLTFLFLSFSLSFHTCVDRIRSIAFNVQPQDETGSLFSLFLFSLFHTNTIHTTEERLSASEIPSAIATGVVGDVEFFLNHLKLLFVFTPGSLFSSPGF